MINVVSYKWGQLYEPRYWNILRASVKRNLTVPHRFIVICDNDIGLDSDMEVIKMDMGVDFFDFWTKMTIFRQNPFGIDGRILLLDVDTVITGNLDEVVALDGEFYTYWNRRSKRIAFAVTLMDASARSELWNIFITDKEQIIEKYVRDEFFISDICPNKLFFPRPWMKSYKRVCSTFRGRIGGVPTGCKFVCFHGDASPHQVITDQHNGFGPDRWIADYWRI